MKAIVVALLLAPTLIQAHAQAPGFAAEYSLLDTHYKTYTLTNAYKFHAVFKVEVFNKEMQPALGWQSKETEYQLKPNQSKKVKLKFNVDGQRKLLVCTTLTKIGKDHEKASIISRICSRLIINDHR